MPGAATMAGDNITAPTRPPPPPGPPPMPPGKGEFGPACSLQHDEKSPLVVSVSTSASSNVMISKPSFLNAGDEVISGTVFCRNESIDCRPPGSPLAQPSS